MKVTYNWLKEFVDIDISAEELAKRLTSVGMEVEEIIYQNEHLHDVYVGKILKIEKHPQADKLVVCQVDVGNKVVQIITSATNVFEGAVVPVSLTGADLVNGVKIEKTKFRGVDSEGMFCSGEELGIDENYFEGAGINGILILPNDMVPGTKIEDALLLNDVVYEVGITPNRPDCMSVIGLAREVGAILGKKIKDVGFDYNVDKTDDISKHVSVEVSTINCKRYMAAAVKDIVITRSPMWLRSKLNAVGIKPINTIVDITNYVLIEMGQPLHAFDETLIAGHKINVRQAKNGEKIEVLNHNTYELNQDDMVIADKDKAMVIAGVIGGVNSCIQENSKDAIFESAVFDLKSIRITSKKIGVRTDSSARYSKGVNVASSEVGLKRALHLIDKLKLGKIVSGIVDITKEKNETRTIYGSVKEINKILGVEIPVNKMIEILECLGIKTTITGDKITAIVPPYREDIEVDCDLAEEIIRFYGYDVYDNLTYSLFENSCVTAGKYNDKLELEKKFKHILVDKGFFECVNFSICPSDICKKLLIDDDRKNMIKIANPISDEISCLRSIMVHSSLANIAYNQSVNNKDIRLFEAGRVYLAKELPLKDAPVENDYVSFVVCEDGYDFFTLKGVVETLLSTTSLKYKLDRSTEPFMHPGISADIIDENGEKVGTFGQIHPQVMKNYELAGKVFYGELNIEKLVCLPEKKFKVNPVPKFPVVERDLAFVVDENVTNEELVLGIKSCCGKLFYDIKLFDIYRSKQLGDNVKSMAYNIKLVDENKTLTEEEVNAITNKIIKSLAYRYNAKLRG